MRSISVSIRAIVKQKTPQHSEQRKEKKTHKGDVNVTGVRRNGMKENEREKTIKARQ